MKNVLYTLAKLVLMATVFTSLQACAPSDNAADNSVTAAYETSGLVPLQPYTRTIFSSHNF